jgi:hypothetical protein
MRDHVSQPYRTTGKIIVLYILIFIVNNSNSNYVQPQVLIII